MLNQDEGKNEPQPVSEEDVFAGLKLNLAQQERKTQSDSLKDCSMKDEKNPLYNAQKSKEKSAFGLTNKSTVAPPKSAAPKSNKIGGTTKKGLKHSMMVRTDATQVDIKSKKSEGRRSVMKVDPTQGDE